MTWQIMKRYLLLHKLQTYNIFYTGICPWDIYENPQVL